MNNVFGPRKMASTNNIIPKKIDIDDFNHDDIGRKSTTATERKSNKKVKYFIKPRNLKKMKFHDLNTGFYDTEMNLISGTKERKSVSYVHQMKTGMFQSIKKLSKKFEIEAEVDTFDFDKENIDFDEKAVVNFENSPGGLMRMLRSTPKTRSTI